MDKCPDCGETLTYDEIDGISSNPRCEECYWHPGAVKVPCECGCKKMSYSSNMDFNHPEDFRDERP